MKNASKTETRREGEALIRKIGKFAEDLEGYEPSEKDLLDIDEMLVELRDHPAADAQTRRWADRLIAGVGKRLETGDFADYGEA